ncbi:MAG: DUF4390 domain-containing protein [Deltaproteobacteria bacterium]|nr:DUF4390 domain-containing protein [Candidatus Anaeroferrophillacea bacterium]
MKKSSALLFRRTGTILLVMLVSNIFHSSNINAKTPDQIRLTADNPPYLEEFVLGQRSGATTLDVVVANPFDRTLKNLILNGVKQDITLLTTVNCKKTYLFLVNFDRHVSSATYRQSIFFDTLKKVFVVNFDGRQPTVETSSYRQALHLVSSFRDLPLLTRRQRHDDADYSVRVRAEIQETRLPFHLEYLFFFLSAWDRQTQTYIIDIPRPAENPVNGDERQ